MSVVRYLPGEEWLCVVRSGVVVMVPATTAADVLDRLWSRLGETPNLQAILPIVAGGFGQGLDSMPPFGVVSYTDRLHVLLRGEVRLSVANDDGAAPLELSGEYVTTWTERMLDGGARHFSMSAGAPAGLPGADLEGSALPLEAGVVRSASVSVGLSGSGGAPTVTAEPAPIEPVRAEAAPVEPAPFLLPPSQPAALEPAEEEDPEHAITGALEAEESATINPSLYLTFNDEPEPRPEPEPETEPEPEPEPGPEPEEDPELNTTGYDHLWDQTVVRRVEDAAVRPAEDDDAEEAPVGEPAGQDAHATTGSGAHAGAQPAEAPAQPEVSQSKVSQPELSRPDVSQVGDSFPQSAPLTEATPVPLPAPGQLIDSVPWARKSAEPPKASAVPASSPIPPMRGPAVPAAPVSIPPGPAGPGVPPDGLDLDDHDGQTIMRSELESPAPTSVQPSPEPRPGTGPLVLARLCPQGHANPPEASACGVCSQPVDGEPREVRRPSLGTMRISTGEVVELDQSIVIGRQPSVSRVQGRGMPKLVQVTSAGGDISRSHAEVRLDGWHVLLCDLKATNGTVLIRQGQPPRRLGEGETAFLLDGDVAQLGDDVFLRFEGLR
ncbi:FHA domain-containing protein [Arthrobacter sp. D2-10]